MINRGPATGNDGVVGSERAMSDVLEPQPAPAPASSMTAAPALAYADFAAALKDALRDFHSPDLVARNPLLRYGIRNLPASAGSLELQTLLTESTGTLFGNPR
jgi:hypothetical protein